MKKIVSKILMTVSILCVFLLMNVECYAANPTINISGAKNISDNDARIEGYISNPSKFKVTETGFYIGTSSGNLSKCGKHDSGSWPYSKVTIGYTMSQYYGGLNAGTTYYYKFYAIVNGTEYQSGESSFTTTGNNQASQPTPQPEPQTISKASLSYGYLTNKNISEKDARIEAKINNPDRRNVTETGFYIGTTTDGLAKANGRDNGSWSDPVISVGYTMSKYYGTLQPGTTYYYSFYAIGDGEEFRSDINSFTTSGSVPGSVQQQQTQSEQKPANNTVTASISDCRAESITTNDAIILAVINNPDGQSVTQTGFYINGSKVGKFDEGNWKDGRITIKFSMGKYFGSLAEGTTYTYQFYAIVNGTEIQSEEKSFTTASNKVTAYFSDMKAIDVTTNDATFKATLVNPDGQKVTETGVYVDGTKSSKKDTGSWSQKQIGLTFNYQKYYGKELGANMCHTYKFYAIVNGKEIISDGMQVEMAVQSTSKIEENTKVDKNDTSLMAYAEFSQNDPRWAESNKDSEFYRTHKQYGPLIQKQGCYLCSIAMVLNNMGYTDTNPATLYDRNGHNSYIYQDRIISYYKKNFGSNIQWMEKFSSNTNTIIDFLTGTNTTGNNPNKLKCSQGVILKLNNGSHYIVARRVDENGNIIVDDPDNADNSGGVFNVPWTELKKESRISKLSLTSVQVWYE